MTCIRFAFVCLLLAAVSAGAQTSAGEVNGTVSDPSKSAVAGAQVTLVNTVTRLENRATTNADGYYVFVNVAPGAYSLKIENTGFKGAQLPTFTVGVNQTVTQDVSLQLGQVSETVNVSAEAELIQKSSAELGTVIQEKAVEDLPLNGRNFTQLLSLTPGATPVNTAQGGGVSFQDAGPSGIPGSNITKPSIHGQQNRSLLYFMDGFINTDLRGPIYGILPIVDSIQEFKVQGHNDKAEYGGVTGGIVNVVSRSGGNDYHGSGWQYLRNNFFDARNPFVDITPGLGPAAFRQNQYGATIGGPIKHQKTFWFGAWEGWRYTKPTQTLDLVATPAELNGDFTNSVSKNQIYNPYSTRKNPANTAQIIRDPFVCDPSGNPVTPLADGTQVGGTACNKIPTSLISAPMQSLLKTYFAPSNFPLTASQNYIENRPTIDNANSWQVKVDHRFNDSNNVFFRFSQILDHHLDTLAATLADRPSDYHGNNYGGGWTRVMGAHLILDVRAGILQKPYVFNQTHSAKGIEPLKSAGFQNIDKYGGLNVTVGSPWTGNELGNRGDSIRRNPDWSGSANLNWIHGRHNFRMGYQYIYVGRDQINTFQLFGYNGTITNNPVSTANTGLSLASALLGFPASSSGELPDGGEVNFHLGTWSIYGQDEWKVSRKVTLNLGLRWDVLTQPHVNNSRLFNALDLFAGKWIIGASASEIPACNTSNTNPCFPGAGLSSVPFNDHIVFAGSRAFNPPPVYDNIGPRFGLAWEATHNTVVRIGYGLYYDALPARSQYAQNDLEAGQWPWVRAFSGSPNSVVGAALVPITAVAGQLSQGVPASPWNSLQSTFFDDPHYKDGWSQQYSVEIQRQMSSSTVFSVAYVGSVNGRLPYTGRANGANKPFAQGTPATTVDTLRAMPFMTSAFKYTQNIGEGNYNSFQTKLQRRFNRGLMTLISYTWSKSLDNSSGYFDVENGAGQGGATVSDYFNPGLNRGPSGYDIPHFFSWYTVYHLPFGKGERWLTSGPAAWVLGNWQANFIFQARSGQPFNINVGGDPANIGGSIGGFTGYSRPDVVGNPIPATQTAQLWFDPNAFAVPSGHFGNYGRNSLRTSHVVNQDFSMFKTIKIGERRELQLRFEGFNVLNIQNLGVPATTTIQSTAAGNLSSGVGRITSLAGGTNPRQIQFGARFRF